MQRYCFDICFGKCGEMNRTASNSWQKWKWSQSFSVDVNNRQSEKKVLILQTIRRVHFSHFHSLFPRVFISRTMPFLFIMNLNARSVWCDIWVMVIKARLYYATIWVHQWKLTTEKTLTNRSFLLCMLFSVFIFDSFT